MSEETEQTQVADATPSIVSCPNLWTAYLPAFVIVPTVDRIQMVSDLSDEIKSNRISHRFFYWDVECAYNWVTLEHDEEYQLALQSRELLKQSFAKIQNAIFDETNAPYDLVNLGVGSGSDDKVMLEELSKALCSRYPDAQSMYFPVDISFDLLLHTMGTVSRSGKIDKRRVTPCILNADFFTLPSYLDVIKLQSPNPKLFSLLGSTLSNYSELELLDAIGRTMTEQDYLLLGVDCIYDYLTPEQIRQNYTKSKKGYRFLMGPLRSLLSVGDPQLLPSHFLRAFPEEDIQAFLPDTPLSSLNDHRKVITVVHKLRVGERKYIELSLSHKYNSGALLEFLSHRGYQNVLTVSPRDYPSHVTQYEDCSYTLLLLKKSPALNNQALPAVKVIVAAESEKYKAVDGVLDGWKQELSAAQMSTKRKKELSWQITTLQQHLASQDHEIMLQVYRVLRPRFKDAIAVVKDELKNAVDLLQYNTNADNGRKELPGDPDE